MRATPPGTGNASAAFRAAWPILWRARVASGRRNARKGVGYDRGRSLRYVLSLVKTSLCNKPRQARYRGGSGAAPEPGVRWRTPCGLRETCCDALRCSGPHARYTDRASEYSLGRKARVILLNSVVLGIEHCNYCSSTRNP